MKTSNEISAEKKVGRKELMSVFWRSFTINASYQYERQMNQGFVYSLTPVINKLYDKKEDRVEALQRHSEFFNVTPMVSPFVMGITAAMEEENANDEQFDAKSISAVKSALMGPLSGIGDSVFWGTLRPLAAGIACSLALAGNAVAPILFYVLFNVFNVACRYFGLFKGYELGTSFLSKMAASGIMQKVFLGASIIGMLVIGAMTASMVSVNLALSIGEGDSAILLNDVINGIMPKLLPLLVTLLLYKLIRKGWKVNTLLLGIVVVSIACCFVGIL
ncbi:PTS system mannose/fructose/sorbose family transporter subunit IID [Olsenella sp. An293]|uniref:PTS system mannose/fructose/sorbose family transporter subunit IID n=1 Tax=Olsenella sp. An293 TaxID=1965626 RepID=UPI000B386761|nr:PTS system mannose/fructose/sorbose family transporter subunit IID [Olsenella sp. An293]OUO33880.1 PTS mannose transporter subunit IID [Olsenella sp. An293]